MPTISVAMSVYNGEKYLSESIESILNQSFGNFEFIIADDGSKDNTYNILNRYANIDKRIKIIKNDKNIGLTKTLNIILEKSSGDYIARMDADDISRPLRFEKQINFFKKNSNVGVCSVNGIILGNDKKFINQKIFLEHEGIDALLIFKNSMPHAPVMIRKKILHDNNIKYNENYIVMQDYELWINLIKVTKFNILEEVLYEVRDHDKRITFKTSKIENYRENILTDLFARMLSGFGIEPKEIGRASCRERV